MFLDFLKDKILSNIFLSVLFVLYVGLISFAGILLLELKADIISCFFSVILFLHSTFAVTWIFSLDKYPKIVYID